MIQFSLIGKYGLTPLMLAAQDPDLNTLLDNLLNFEADPLIQDDQGLNAMDHACDVEVKHMLENFIADSCHRGLSDAHSFDETVDEEANKNDEDYTLPFGMRDDQPIHDQDHVQDLDSWQSSEDSTKESRMKQSKAMLDLSKFNLEDSEDQDDQDQGQVPEKIYDSVENVREEVKKLEFLKQISTPLLSLKEPEIIQDDAQVLEDYSEWDDDEPNLPLESSRRLDLDSQEALIPIPLRAPKGLKDLKKSPKKTRSPILSPKFKTPPLLSPNMQQSFEQPRSLDLVKTPSKRRGSRKSRSLRSTHLAMMSKPILSDPRSNLESPKNDGSTSSLGMEKFIFWRENSKKKS